MESVFDACDVLVRLCDRRRPDDVREADRYIRRDLKLEFGTRVVAPRGVDASRRLDAGEVVERLGETLRHEAPAESDSSACRSVRLLARRRRLRVRAVYAAEKDERQDLVF